MSPGDEFVNYPGGTWQSDFDKLSLSLSGGLRQPRQHRHSSSLHMLDKGR